MQQNLWPHSLEAERGVLGSIIINPDSIHDVAGILRPDDFYNEAHRSVYEAMLVLSAEGRPIDTVTLIDALGATDINPSMLVDFGMDTPSHVYVHHYAEIVAEKATRRRLVHAANRLAELAHGEQPIADALDLAETAVLAVRRLTMADEARPMSVIVPETIDRMDKIATDRANGVQDDAMISTGFKTLDTAFGGLRGGRFYLIGGRPGMGKTSMALAIADHAALVQGKAVSICSLEMSEGELTRRLLANRTNIDSRRLEESKIEDDEWVLLMDIANQLQSAPIHINDKSDQTVISIRNMARRLKQRGQLDLLIIDYLQLVGSGGGRADTRQEEVANISRTLKLLAKELNIPVICMVQLANKVEERSDKRPLLSDLRESGAPSQDADAVFLLYREDYYFEDTDRQNIADILCRKNRHGATGSVSLYYRKELTQFRDLEVQRTELN